MVQIMHRPPEITPAQVSSPEVNSGATPNYVNTLRIDVINDLFDAYPNLEGQDNGNIVDLDTNDVIAVDPLVAAQAGEPIQVEALSDDLLADVLETVLDPQPGEAHFVEKLHLRNQIIAEGDEREKRAAQGSADDTRVMPAVTSAVEGNKDTGKPRRGLMDRVNDRLTRMETKVPAKASAKAARKELKAFNKDNNAIKKLSQNAEEREAVEAKRAELEQQAGSYKAWKSAQRGERRAVTHVVGGMINKLRGSDPAKIEQRNERRALGSEIADANRNLVKINGMLDAKGLDETTKTQLLAERDRQKAIIANAHEKKKAGTHKLLGNRAACSAVATDHDAEFDKLPMPNDDARELFKNLHDKRIKALKLGLEAGYKIRSRKNAYETAYAEYKEAYFACETAILKHETDAEGPLTDEERSELVTSMVIEEIHNMQKWQYQLAAESQSTRRGRVAVWYNRQGKVTKLALGAAAGLATGGLAGLAGGAVAGAGLVLAKVARSEGNRRATGLANQRVYEVTKADKIKYQEKSKSSGQIFDKIFTDQVTYVEKSVRKKRAGLAIGVVGLVGGALAGDWLNDNLGKGKTAEVRASRPTTGGGTGTGAAETVPPIGEPRRVTVTLDDLRPRGGSAGAARIDGGVAAAVTSGNTNSGGTVAAVAERYVGNISPIDGHTIEYPWDVFGNETWNLADKAIAGGENMQWRGEGTQAQLWAKVDGKWTSDTDKVVNILKKYR